MPLLKILKSKLKALVIPSEIAEKIDKATPKLNSAGIDPWGLDPETLKSAVTVGKLLYSGYFRTEVTGLTSVPTGRLMVISNHGCQIPLDGLFITLAMLLETENPRICRGMVDHWVPSLPFVSELFTACGEIVGAPDNCIDMLNEENCVLVFPEGTRGSGKTIFEKYQLKSFGTGFIRIALETNSPILPVAVIGTEEIFPSLINLKFLAKILKIPYFPVTPFFPHFGPLGAIPLPTKVTLRFGEPIIFTDPPDISESRAAELAEFVRTKIQEEINIGLKLRGTDIFTAAAL
jgi:1-acyl-sn-glycerol-3-phosphate acyltransferase